jgi:hypothetical protein
MDMCVGVTCMMLCPEMRRINGSLALERGQKSCAVLQGSIAVHGMADEESKPE